MKQKDIFLATEGDHWFERNRDALANLRSPDPVVVAVEGLTPTPKRVLEVGCANGWRLAYLRDTLGCEIMGVEPSRAACIEAASNRVPVVQSTASVLAVSGKFDVVIYGFCLYLTDPADWLQIAAEGNNLLLDGGHLVIEDFPREPGMPFARRYEHCDGLLSHHMRFEDLWLSHPWYKIVNARGDSTSLVTVLKKNSKHAIPVKP